MEFRSFSLRPFCVAANDRSTTRVVYHVSATTFYVSGARVYSCPTPSALRSCLVHQIERRLACPAEFGEAALHYDVPDALFTRLRSQGRTHLLGHRRRRANHR